MGRAPTGLLRDSAAYALGFGYTVTLRIVDAHTPEHRNDLFVLRKLGNGLLAGEVPDFINRAYHFAVDRIMQYLLDETTVDLEEVYREVFQVPERRQAGAEIVQCEFAAEFLKRIDKPVRLRVTGNRGCLRNLEADLCRVQA